MLAEHRAVAAELAGDPALDPRTLEALLGDEHSAVLAIEAAPQGPGPAARSPGLELVAAAGLTRANPSRRSRRARLWGVFVEERLRGRGLGTAVGGAALALARTWPGLDFVDLGVSARAPAAARLYARLGFEPW